MEYLVNQKDIEFIVKNLLDLNNLKEIPAFAEYNADDFLMIANEALKFTQKEIAPLNASGDKTGAKLENGKVTLPEGFKELYSAYGQNGFFAVDIDPKFGGQGLPILMNSILLEYVMGANCSFGLMSMLSKGSANLIATFGKEEDAMKYCPKMFSGEWAGTMCLTEPQAGSALGDITTKASPIEGNKYKISGNKIFITNGDHNCAENIIHLVLARVDGDPAGSKGISLFVVPKMKIDEQGQILGSNDVAVVNIEHKMGINASPTCLLSFGENQNCEGILIGTQGQGLGHMFQLMNEARLSVGVQGLAIGAAAYEHAKNYALDRTQGGNKIIAEYPDVKRNLSLCKAYTEGVRALLLQSALYADLAHQHPEKRIQEQAQDFIDFLTPICKAYGSDRGIDTCNIAMMVLGGYGYTQEYPIEQYLRDVKIAAIYEGTNGIQALDLIGRKLRIKNGGLFSQFYDWVDSFCSNQANNDELGASVQVLKENLNVLKESVVTFSKSEADYVQLHASPFLMSCGDVVCSFLLLKSAVVAQKLLQEGSSGEDQIKFLKNKIQTAKFFAHQILPNCISRLASLKSQDQSAFEIEFA